MTADEQIPAAEGLATQLRELEAFVAKSEAAGEEMPPEAREMMERLREIVAALNGLTSSLEAGVAPAPFVVRELDGPTDLAGARRLVEAHADERATTPGVEFVRDDAARLPGPYLPPRGGLWVAAAGDEVVGCVALRELDEGAAEVKRMFVDAAWRGRGVGRALLTALIEGARARGYDVLRLGTLDDMEAAKALYHSMGFRPIERYRPDELVHTRFFELALRPSAPHDDA